MDTNNHYPVYRLNYNITQFLAKVVSSDIIGNLNTGLENEIQIIDDCNHITDIASVGLDPITGKSKVRLSAAYCQYYWFVSDIAMKIMDRHIIEESCRQYNISIEDFRTHSEKIAATPIEYQQAIINIYPDIDVEKYVSYFKCVPEILDSTFYQQMQKEYQHAMSIINKSENINLAEIQNYDLNTKYHERVNSVYCYGIAFILLHELSHHALGHVGQPHKDGDEENADMSAFWSIFSDIVGEKRVSANAAMLFVFFSFMELDPSLKEDKVHPRDDKRMFAVYDIIKDENPKYTEILVRLLDFWARINDKKDYPYNLPITEESVEIIKAYFSSLDTDGTCCRTGDGHCPEN